MTVAASASAAASAIYNQHRAAFANVSAYVVMHDGQRVATIAFKYPRDGAGRLYAYVHWIGTPMVRGFAAGGGYDKRTAACAAATRKMPDTLPTTCYADGTPHHPEAESAAYAAFHAALAKDDGHDWSDQLRRAGFNVFQAV
jgi:hypothetical protein